ncbi:MAG: Panacea domain-containing protein [Anaerovoracaceae bacterium]
MTEKERKDFCTECRRETEYVLQKKNIVKTIKDKIYNFHITAAVCTECGREMCPPGLIDKNVQEMDEQYRAVEGIVTTEDIEKMMKLYKIGKAPLSLALGFGEITVTRYLSGQIPSKEYSDILRKALSSPAYMKEMLVKNKDKIADAAYSKAMDAVSQLENLFSVSEKMLRVISYVFERLEEVTPLMLQKLLYFIQGTSYALYGRCMFVEDCQAWVHGPVYPEVYDLFKDFKYNPIEDARFAILDGTAEELTEEERNAIDLVLNTFGLYGGKVLERITHNEAPWREARAGYGDGIPSTELIPKASIRTYYKSIHEQYGLDSEAGMNRYISDMLKKPSAR